MIWFKCKKCQKTQGRPDSAAGTMIFCDCGHGNTIPWESTTAEPAAPIPVVSVPKGPLLEPLQFDPSSVPTVGGHTAPPAAPLPPINQSSDYPVHEPPPVEEDRPYRRGRTEKRDPDYCFNHQRRPRVGACAECEENFCADCLVKFQGALLCGPCKNFRARREELPPAASSMATASLMISLIAGPLMMCLLIAKPGDPSMRVLCYLSLLPQMLAIGLGAWALYEAEKERKGGGQWVAISGIATAGLTCVLMLLLQIFANQMAVGPT
jgi:hypothetical protein